MKEGLIKITGEDNLFYDSIKKEYKYRTHCPHCHKPTRCWCYGEDEGYLDGVPMFDEERPQVYCSDVHFCLDEDVGEIASEMGITVKPTMEEWNAHKIVKVYCEEADFDWTSGSGCTV